MVRPALGVAEGETTWSAADVEQYATAGQHNRGTDREHRVVVPSAAAACRSEEVFPHRMRADEQGRAAHDHPGHSRDSERLP